MDHWFYCFLIRTSGIFIYNEFFQWGLLDTPVFVGFRNYSDMFTRDPLFWKSLKVTFIYAGVSVPAGLALSLLLAILLNQQIKGMNLFRTIFYH